LQIDRAARIAGRTWLGLVVHDALCAIDYLAIRPEIDSGCLGALGDGPGAALALHAAAVDDRLAALMVCCYLGEYRTACSSTDLCRCCDLPGMPPQAEMGDVAGLIAPRPALYVCDPVGAGLATQAARESYAVAQSVYRALDVPRHVRLVESHGARKAVDDDLAIAWFTRWLR
jgi:hypothetical protein